METASGVENLITVWPFNKKSRSGSVPKANGEGVQHQHNAFGCFAPLFERGGYLSLLNLEGPNARHAISLVVRCCASVSNPHEDVCRLLREINWRPHLVGAVAIATLTHDREVTLELWSAIDRGSWVTPQLAAAAFLRDPLFANHARERLRSGCIVHTTAYARLPALERHVSIGPAGTAERSAKTAASLIRLLELLPQRPDWLSVETTSLDLENVLKRDLDSSAELTEQWLSKLKNYLARLGATAPGTT